VTCAIGKLRDENNRKEGPDLTLRRTNTSTSEAVAEPELLRCMQSDEISLNSIFLYL